MTVWDTLWSLDLLEAFEVFAPAFLTVMSVCLALYLAIAIYRGIHGFRIAGHVVLKPRPTTGWRLVYCLLGAIFVIAFLVMIFEACGLFYLFFVKQYAGYGEIRQVRFPPLPMTLYGSMGCILLPMMFCFAAFGLAVLLGGITRLSAAFHSFTIRDMGITAYTNPLSPFIRWDRVSRAVWYKPNTIRIELDSGSHKFSVHSIYVEQVTEAFGSFAKVVDYDTYKSAGKKSYPRPRKRFQFRLSTLMLVTLLLAVFSAHLGARLHEAMHTRQICAELLQTGASVDCWGLAILYVGWHEESRQPTDDDLAILEQLDYVTVIRVYGPRVTEEGLRHFRSLTTLQDLELLKTNITNKGLEHLAPLYRLERLSLNGSPIADEGLQQIGKLKNLEILNLDGTRVTDAGLEHLGQLKNLHTLSLKNTKITSLGLVHLKRLPKLRSVYIGGTVVTRAVVAEVLPDVSVE